MNCCKSIGCMTIISKEHDFCFPCLEKAANSEGGIEESQATLSQKYPAYYKDVGDQPKIDIFAIHHLFEINDPSGCIHLASKKLLMCSNPTSGKPTYQAVKEARDALTRWLQLNEILVNKPM